MNQVKKRFPPDFDELFEQRQLQYAALGIEAASLASRLRTHAGFSQREKGGWDAVAYMKEAKGRIEARWKQPAEEALAMHAAMKSPQSNFSDDVL